jgi:hypothetical protein
MNKIKAFVFLFALTFSLQIHAQTLTKQQVHDVVNAVADSVKTHYVDEQIALHIVQSLQQNIKTGVYDTITGGRSLASILSTQLIRLSNDKHFGIDFNAATVGTTQRRMPSSYANLAVYNYYYSKMEILPGNIGLLQIDRFIPPDYTGQLVVAAMNFFSNSDALIIDLRNCVGGDPGAVMQLAGYFFEKPVVFHASFMRSTNSLQEFHTTKTSFEATETGRLAFGGDKRSIKSNYDKLTKMPVYILTSNTTFSSGEMFAYGMQAQKRARTVGETTGKGGNGIRPFSLPHGYTAFIPFVAAVNPVTKTGWQQTGVAADVAVSSAKALDSAHNLALRELLNVATDETMKKRLTWELRIKELRKNKGTAIDPASLTGKYGVAQISLEDGDLYHSHIDGVKRILQPLAPRHYLYDREILLVFDADLQSFSLQRMSGTETKFKRTM